MLVIWSGYYRYTVNHYLSSFSIAACSSLNVTVGSRVKLADFPSDDVTLIFFLAGLLVGLGELGLGGVAFVEGGGVTEAYS